MASWLLTKSSVSRHTTTITVVRFAFAQHTVCLFFYRVPYMALRRLLVKGGRCSFGRQQCRSPLWQIFNQSFHAQFIDINGFYVKLMIEIWLLYSCCVMDVAAVLRCYQVTKQRMLLTHCKQSSRPKGKCEWNICSNRERLFVGRFQWHKIKYSLIVFHNFNECSLHSNNFRWWKETLWQKEWMNLWVFDEIVKSSFERICLLLLK